MTGIEAILDEPGWRIRDRVAAREASAREVAEASLARLAERDPQLHAFLTVDPGYTLAEADRIDASLRAGEQPGPLCGVPISIKDLYRTKGLRTTAGSLVYSDFVPEDDSVHAQRVRAAGGVIIGKTNTPEFGLFPRTINRLAPETVNPFDPARTCGGSSGGAAASVAAGITPLAVGSDGGGSIRIPAALCGTVGAQPSRGLVPRHGGIGGTLLFSSAGPITRDVRDAAILLQALAGHDPRDPLSRTAAPPDLLSGLASSVAGVRIKWVADSGLVPADAAVLAVAEHAVFRLREAGAILSRSARGLDAGTWVDPFYTMMGADRYASIGEHLYTDPVTRQQLSDYGLSHFRKAASISGAQYSRALEKRFQAIRCLDELFDGADVLATPTVGITAPTTSQTIDRLPLVAYTFLVNYTGYAAATVPCGVADGLPVGVQIIGRPATEALVLQVCHTLQEQCPKVVPRLPASATESTRPQPGTGLANTQDER